MRLTFALTRETLKRRMAQPFQVEPQEAEAEMPPYMESFLAHLRVLVGVPFEYLIADPRLLPVMHNVRKSQPTARRIVRGAGRGESELVHRFVDRDAGLEALLDAVTADMPLS